MPPRRIRPDLPEEVERARLRSEQIDSELASEAAFLARKRQSEVTLLLLGQSESGKSTLQKQFQLLYAPTSLETERSAWRGIIYANIISTIRQILEALNLEGASADSPLSDDDNDDTGSIRQPTRMDSDLLNLQYRLSPLLSMEDVLAERLNAGYHIDSETGSREMFVRRGWQFLAPPSDESRRSSLDSPQARASLEHDVTFYQASRLLEACKGDVQALWRHSTVHKLIKRRKIVVKESSELFLEDIDRISSPFWIPTNDDILFARIRTVGIAEYAFELTLKARLINWRIIDVGGTKSQRQAWVPFFEGSSAIIFMAPVSAYDQFLDEDRTKNRIDDSLQLFSSICAHPLLQRTHIVLFLNKIDVLRRKLRNGGIVRKFISSYGDRPNKAEDVCQYFRHHFRQRFAESKPCKTRHLFPHSTSVVDTVAMRKMMGNVLQSVLTSHLAQAQVLD